MSLDLIITLVALGAIGGYAAGFLGMGGGILLFPLLFYVPPLLGLGSLDARTVAALVISEVFFASVIGGVAHWRSGRVHGQLTLIAAVTAAAGSFFGGIASKWVSEWFLLVLFAVLLLLAAIMMLLPAPSADREMIPVERVIVSPMPLAVLSCATGIVVGFIGAGNFIFVPLLIYVLKVPTRISIGSNLVIAALSTLSGLLGKLVTGQVPFLMALAVVGGAASGVLIGERSHGQVSPRVLRYVYAGVIGVVGIRLWLTLLS